MFKKIFDFLFGWAKKKLDEKVNPPEPKDIFEKERKQEEEMEFKNPSAIVVRLTLNRVTPTDIYFTQEGERHWQMDRVSPGCDGEAHLFVKRLGAWWGGKFDHVRPSSNGRDFKNMPGDPPYWCGGKYAPPVVGDDVAVLVTDYDHKERSNAIFFKWV